MSKISELSDGGSLISSDYLIAVRSGGNVKVRMNQINVDQVDLGDNEFIRLGNSQDLTMVHTSTQSIINQAGIGDLLLQKAGATKLTINASGIDVTGSVTADGLTVDGDITVNDATPSLTLSDTGGTNQKFVVSHNGATSYLTFRNGTNYGALQFLADNGTTTATRQSISSNGDISFYEDTGTTPKFVWDASAEALGIGTSSPIYPLEVVGAAGDSLTITARSGDATAANNAGGGFRNIGSATATSRSAQMWLDADGANLSGGDYFYMEKKGNSGDLILSQYSNADIIFRTNAEQERMRIDASGNLLVGGTNINPSQNAVEGIALSAGSYGGYFSAARSGGVVAQLARLTNDGTILDFRNSTDSVGSIGTTGGGIYLGSPSGAGKYFANNGNFSPSTDGSKNLGDSSLRWQNLYLSGGMNLARDISSETEIETYNNTNSGGAKYKISFRQNSAEVGVIEVGTSSTNYLTSSDYRLKENVVAMSGATERLKQLAPKRFNFKTTPDATVDGFLAHEVQDIVPEAISGTKDAVDAEGNPVHQGIDQSKLVPLLVATIQELEARIAALES